MSMQRTGETVFQELLDLAREMAQRGEDSGFLLQAMDRRQALMDEFDRRRTEDPAFYPPAMKPSLHDMAGEILRLDRESSAALSRLKEEAKEHLRVNNTQQRVLGYINNAISSSGSYMDYRR